MEIGSEWEPKKENRDELLAEYHERRGGLFFAKVVVKTEGSRNRYAGGIRIADPPEEELEGKAYRYGPEIQDRIRQMVSRYPAELVEAYRWGFDAFGRVLGKSRIIERNWNP